MSQNDLLGTESEFKVAVAGAGVMGSGIVYQCARTDIDVILRDLSSEACDRGFTQIKGLFDRQLNSARIDQDTYDRQCARIHLQSGWDGFEQVDIVIEAIVEDPELKSKALQEIESQLNENALLTSNTSTISINALANSLKRPELFCGLHFFNPVAQMKLVEVVRGERTSDECIDRCVAFAQELGKTPVVVGDCPGFLVNRLLFPYFHGFHLLLQEGVSFERIDKLMTDFGWPMGPAYLADVIGMDVMVGADRVLAKGYPDRMCYDGSSIFERLLEAGLLGQKQGAGFYCYFKDDQGNRVREPNHQMTHLIHSSGASLLRDISKTSNLISDSEICQRMMLPMCTEALRCLQEAVVARPEDIDLAVNLGLGFPKSRGGLMHYIDSLTQKGLRESIERFKHLGGLYRLVD